MVGRDGWASCLHSAKHTGSLSEVTPPYAMLCQRDSSLMRSLALAALGVTTARSVSCLWIPCLCFFSSFAKWATPPFLAVSLVATGGAIWSRPLLLCSWVRICSLQRTRKHIPILSPLCFGGQTGVGSEVRNSGGGRGSAGTCRSVLDKGSWVTQGKYGLALPPADPREALAVLFPTCPALPSPAPLCCPSAHGAGRR